MENQEASRADNPPAEANPDRQDAAMDAGSAQANPNVAAGQNADEAIPDQEYEAHRQRFNRWFRLENEDPNHVLINSLGDYDPSLSRALICFDVKQAENFCAVVSSDEFAGWLRDRGSMYLSDIDCFAQILNVYRQLLELFLSARYDTYENELAVLAAKSISIMRDANDERMNDYIRRVSSTGVIVHQMDNFNSFTPERIHELTRIPRAAVAQLTRTERVYMWPPNQVRLSDEFLRPARRREQLLGRPFPIPVVRRAPLRGYRPLDISFVRFDDQGCPTNEFLSFEFPNPDELPTRSVEGEGALLPGKITCTLQHLDANDARPTTTRKFKCKEFEVNRSWSLLEGPQRLNVVNSCLGHRYMRINPETIHRSQEILYARIQRIRTQNEEQRNREEENLRQHQRDAREEEERQRRERQMRDILPVQAGPDAHIPLEQYFNDRQNIIDRQVQGADQQ